LGMGLPGLATRVLALAQGGLLTFAALRRGAESASGQPTIDELKTLYRAHQLTRESQIFGVIGNPVEHSRSPRIHNPALQAAGVDGVYLPLEVDDIASFITDFVHPKTKKLDWDLHGLSVTIPHKVSVIPLLDHLDETAKAIGAVNTVVIRGNELHGYNTDVTGAMNALAPLFDVRNARVAVLGAGGSARAICYGLKQRGANITIYARDLAKAQTLADEFGAAAARLDQFDGQAGRQAEVVINCTPIGMHGHSEGQSPIAASALQNVKLVYDLIYTPRETALLQAARAQGCQTLDGLAMLVNQAAEQFRLFTGKDAPLEVMWQAVS
jgi:3-dehydroquinate dehydratase / shikimate dehydrogenase